jgi:hypothetical protein
MRPKRRSSRRPTNDPLGQGFQLAIAGDDSLMGSSLPPHRAPRFATHSPHPFKSDCWGFVVVTQQSKALAYLKAERRVRVAEPCGRYLARLPDPHRLEAIEAMIVPGPYAFGSQVTIGLCIVPRLANARRFNGPIQQFPRLLGVEAACQ